MPKKERAAKNAAIAMAKELDSEMTEEERERKRWPKTKGASSAA